MRSNKIKHIEINRVDVTVYIDQYIDLCYSKIEEIFFKKLFRYKFSNFNKYIHVHYNIIDISID